MKFDNFSIQEPDANVKVKDTFEIDSDLKVDSFSESNEYVPKLDADYCFDKATTLSILACKNRKSSSFVKTVVSIQLWNIFITL